MNFPSPMKKVLQVQINIHSLHITPQSYFTPITPTLLGNRVDIEYFKVKQAVVGWQEIQVQISITISFLS